MTEGIRSFFFSLVTAGFIGTIVKCVLPDGAGKKVATVACGLIFALVLLRPIARMDIDDISRAIAKTEITKVESNSGIKIDNEAIISAIIKENAEAYIWDKAEELRIKPYTISVTVTSSGEYPYPSHVCISGEYTEIARQHLAQWIERELAIDSAQQEWIWNESS